MRMKLLWKMNEGPEPFYPDKLLFKINHRQWVSFVICEFHLQIHLWKMIVQPLINTLLLQLHYLPIFRALCDWFRNLILKLTTIFQKQLLHRRISNPNRPHLIQLRHVFQEELRHMLDCNKNEQNNLTDYIMNYLSKLEPTQ